MKNNYLKSMIWGGVVGDALGVPYEFKLRGQFQAQEMIGNGTYDLPAGSWSDDISMTLCTVEHVAKHTTLNQLMDAFVAYAEEDYMTTSSGLFDIGIQTQNAIERWKYLETDAEHCGLSDERSNGNGSLMRIAAILPLTYGQGMKMCLTLARRYSSLTHGHERSVVGCFVYLQLLETVIQYLEQDNRDKEDIIIETEQRITQFLSSEHSYAKLNKEYQQFYKSVLSPTIKGKNIEAIPSSGYVVHTFEAVI